MVANARRVTTLILLFFFSFSLLAQQAPTLGETLEISIVNVDVFVTDKKGNRIHGLTQDDFEVYENGKPQPISNFAEYAGNAETTNVRVDAPAAGPAAAEPAPREQRTILLFFEKTHLPQFAVEPIVKSLKETIRRTVQPGDAVSIVLWSRNGIVHTEFTDDLRVVDGAIDRIARVATHGEIDAALQQIDELEALVDFEKGIASMAGEADATPLSRPMQDNAAINLWMMMAYNEMQVRVAAINSAINSMSGIEGKKILLLATRRLGEIAGAEYAYVAGMQLMPESLKQRFRTDHLMQTIVDNANASGITIYPVNLPGLQNLTHDASRSGMGDSALEGAAGQLTLINEEVSMRNIAQKTGGLMASGPVAIAQLLPRIADDASDYYSLAYRVPSSGGDYTRNIEVKTRNRDYVVRSRRQFVEKSEDTRMRDRLRATLFRAEQDSTVEITATAGAIKKVRGIPTLPVSIRIPIADLTVLPQGEGKHAGKFSVYIAAAADLDELSEVTQKAQPFEIADDKLEEANAGHFTYDVDVKIGYKTKYVAVGVLDEVGRSYGLMRLDVNREQKVQ